MAKLVTYSRKKITMHRKDEMTPSLEGTHRSFIEFSDAARLLLERLQGRMFWRRVLSVFVAFPGRERVLNMVELGPYYWTSEDRKLIEAAARKSEKEDPLFRVILTEYPLESLASEFINRFDLTHDKIESLLKLHKAKAERTINERPQALFGYILAAGALLAKSVPEQVFTFFGADTKTYGKFQLFILIAMAIAFIYASFVVLPSWSNHRKERYRYEFSRKLLEYCSMLAITMRTANSSPAKPNDPPGAS